MRKNCHISQKRTRAFYKFSLPTGFCRNYFCMNCKDNKTPLIGWRKLFCPKIELVTLVVRFWRMNRNWVAAKWPFDPHFVNLSSETGFELKTFSSSLCSGWKSLIGFGIQKAIRTWKLNCTAINNLATWNWLRGQKAILNERRGGGTCWPGGWYLLAHTDQQSCMFLVLEKL